MVATAACLLAPFAFAGPARATYPGRNGLIAYERLGSDNRSHGIWAVDPKSGRKQRLIGGQAFDPSWSLDGRRIAYRLRGRVQGIFVARANGSHARRVTDCEDKHPVFAPTGKRVTFDRHGCEHSTFTIYSTRLDGSHPRFIAYGHDPVYSPDGRWIAYVSGGTGRNPAPPTLHIVHPAGSGDTTIFTGGTNDFITDVDWAPDGSRIAFHSLGQGLVTVDPQGSNQQVVGAYASPISYSPDGRFIAFPAFTSSDNSIDTIPSGGGATATIAQVNTGIGGLAWQPLP